MKKLTADQLRDKIISLESRRRDAFGGTKSENANAAASNYLFIQKGLHDLLNIEKFPSEKIKKQARSEIEYSRGALKQLREQYTNEIREVEINQRMFKVTDTSEAGPFRTAHSAPFRTPGIRVHSSSKKVKVSHLIGKRKPVKKNDPVKAVAKTVSGRSQSTRKKVSVSGMLGKRKPVKKNDPVKAVRKTVARQTKPGALANSEFGKILKRADQIHKSSPIVSTRTINIRRISRAQAMKLAYKEAKRK